MTKHVHMAPPPTALTAETGEQTTMLAWITLAGWCVLFVAQALS